jgi:lipoprotein LprG
MPKRLVMILVALAAAVAFLAGCSKSDEPAKELPDAATLLQQSSQTTKSQTSAHMKLTVEGPTEKLPIELLEGDLSNAPEFRAQGKVNLLMMGQRLEGVEFVVVDGDLYATLTPGGVLSNFGPAVDIYDASLILNPETGLANVLANFSDPKADGRETLNGVETVRVTGNVSADAVNKIAPQIAATGPVPGTAWIAEEGDHELVQVKLQTEADSNLTMVLSEWGKPVTVTKPPAA